MADHELEPVTRYRTRAQLEEGINRLAARTRHLEGLRAVLGHLSRGGRVRWNEIAGNQAPVALAVGLIDESGKLTDLEAARREAASIEGELIELYRRRGELGHRLRLVAQHTDLASLPADVATANVDRRPAVDQLRDLIRGLGPDSYVGSIGDLASEFGADPKTIVRALNQLREEEGIVLSRGQGPGGGWYTPPGRGDEELG